MTLEIICFYIMKMCEQQKLGNFSQHVYHWKKLFWVNDLNTLLRKINETSVNKDNVTLIY